MKFEMLFQFKKLFYIFTFNLTLFLLLMIGIQNSSRSNKVNLIMSETIELPISFIIGISFIGGSITGSLLKITFGKKNT